MHTRTQTQQQQMRVTGMFIQWGRSAGKFLIRMDCNDSAGCGGGGVGGIGNEDIKQHFDADGGHGDGKMVRW